MFDPEELKERVRRYTVSFEVPIDFSRLLGDGTDGIVFESGRNTAIKALARRENYLLEVECYKRLKRHAVERILEFAVPALIGFSDELLIVEMQIVTPPFVVDFGKVQLDRRPDFSPEVMAEWVDDMKELFEGRWPRVRLLLAALERYGIYYTDPKPGNIVFDRKSD